MQELAIVKIRIAQAFRELKALGFFYGAILILGIIALLAFFYQSQTSLQNSITALGILSFLIVSLHFSRNDHEFLMQIAQRPFLIYSMEYFCLVTPFVLLATLKLGFPLFALVYLPVLFITQFKVNRKESKVASLLGKLVPKRNYEWKAGIRQSGWMFVLLWLASLVLVFVPFASLILLWFCLLIISSFYDQGESLEMIDSFKMNAWYFIQMKLRMHIGSFLLLSLPVITLSFLFFPDRWWVFLLFLFFSVINIAVFIVSKYSVWRHGELNKSNSIVNGLCMVGFFLPFLLPLPIAVLIKNFRKSIRNLNPLLNDYH